MAIRFKIGLSDVSQGDVQALIRYHRELALAANQICEGHAMDVSDYADSALALFEVRDGQALLGICGLLRLSAAHGEIKTMHTTAQARGMGIGQALLEHAIQVAAAEGFTQLSLETGTAAYFAAATRLYMRMGFKSCAPFASYTANPDSLFMTRQI